MHGACSSKQSKAIFLHFYIKAITRTDTSEGVRITALAQNSSRHGLGYDDVYTTNFYVKSLL